MKKNPPAPTDIVPLVQAAARGDESACAQLIQLTQNRLLRFCVYLCGNREIAQDLCQDTYLRAFKNLAALEKPSSFPDWLFRIAKNVFLDSVRNQPQLEELRPEELDEASADPDIYLVHSVQFVLSQFEPDDRMLLILVEIEQHSYAEAAEIIKISEDALRSRLHRLRKSFLEKWHELETKSPQPSSSSMKGDGSHG